MVRGTGRRFIDEESTIRRSPGASWRPGAEKGLGQVLALNAIALVALTPLGSLMDSLHQLQAAGAHVERLDDIVTTPRETFPAEAERPEAVVFIRLRSPWILRSIFLSISPGEKIAVIGSSGSGKSTPARLLLGLYQPDEGDIFYNGQLASQLDLRHLRSRFGIVNQEPVLLSGSIRDNICLNDPDASHERMIRAARPAHIHDTIEAMPMTRIVIAHRSSAPRCAGDGPRLLTTAASTSRPTPRAPCSAWALEAAVQLTRDLHRSGHSRPWSLKDRGRQEGARRRAARRPRRPAALRGRAPAPRRT